MKPTIVVCDDEPQRLDEWIKSLETVDVVRRNFELKGITGDDLTELIAALEARRLAARTGQSPPKRSAISDTASILVVDFDLLRLDENTFPTGEGIAYLARCFSNCGLIVALNQFGENVFDLTLRGHPESFADLNIGGSQLGNAGLWSTEFGAYRPWAWPLLPRALEAFERRTRAVREALDTAVLAWLGFSAERSAALPRSTSSFIAAQGRPEETTPRQFVVESGQGLRSRDREAKLDDDATARIAAARLSRWLERLILPGQDILVDAPHMALRLPSLLAGEAKDESAWMSTVLSLTFEHTGVRDDQVAAHSFALKDWVSRPVWWWQGVMNDEKIREVRDPWTVESVGLVFCEDTSRFVSSANAREFVAELDSPFVRRFVEGPTKGTPRENVRYEPAVAFAQ